MAKLQHICFLLTQGVVQERPTACNWKFPVTEVGIQ